MNQQTSAGGNSACTGDRDARSVDGQRSGGMSPLPRRVTATLVQCFVMATIMTAAGCTTLSMRNPSFGGAHNFSLMSAPLAVRHAPVAPDRPADHLYAPNIAIGDSMLLATVVQLRRMSPSFDSAIVAIEQSGIPVVIGAADQLKDQTPPGYRHVDGWQALTAIYPLTPNGARGKSIDHFAVIVRMADLHEALAMASSREDSVRLVRYLERVVAHEIYGHLIPQLQLGKTAPIACADPTGGADWYTACVMQRERHVMAQLVDFRGTYASLNFQ